MRNWTAANPTRLSPPWLESQTWKYTKPRPTSDNRPLNVSWFPRRCDRKNIQHRRTSRTLALSQLNQTAWFAFCRRSFTFLVLLPELAFSFLALLRPGVYLAGLVEFSSWRTAPTFLEERSLTAVDLDVCCPIRGSQTIGKFDFVLLPTSPFQFASAVNCFASFFSFILFFFFLPATSISFLSKQKIFDSAMI